MFDQNKADEVIEFISMLKHTGDFYGKPFNPMPWQKEVLSEVYGTVNENGIRQYNTAYLEIPKKNGKTELIAALAVYHLCMDPPGGQIYCCAAERGQASLVFNAAKDMIEQSDFLGKMIKIKDSVKEMRNEGKSTVMKVLSAEAYSKHGLNPSVVIFDELHALQKRDMWDIMTFGTGAARQQQLVWVITTAGDDPDRKSIGWEQHEISRKVISGEIADPTRYARIYCAEEDDDVFDEEVWFKANPSLGITISLDNVRKEAEQAKQSEAVKRNFRWLRLNQWVALKKVGWLPITLWDATERDWSPVDLYKQKCYVGLDLSSVNDLTGIACLFPPVRDGKWRFFLDAYIPEENIPERERRDHVPFSEWIRGGYVHTTPGDIIDYPTIAERLDELSRQYDVQFIGADPWRIEVLNALMSEKVALNKVVTVPQNIAGMSTAMKEIDRLMHTGELEHCHNPCGRWCFGNVIVSTDGNENIKPNKKMSIERIDPIVALINAMAAALKDAQRAQSVYEKRGLRTL